MYVTIRYYNYRIDSAVSFLKSFKSLQKAQQYALLCAEDEYGDDVVEGVDEKWIEIGDGYEEYTTGNGYGKFVFTVVQVPDPEE